MTKKQKYAVEFIGGPWHNTTHEVLLYPWMHMVEPVGSDWNIGHPGLFDIEDPVVHAYELQWRKAGISGWERPVYVYWETPEPSNGSETAENLQTPPA